MILTGVKTHKITQKDKDILKILDRYVKKLSENSVVAVASKIVAITEGRFVKIGSFDKDQLVKQEAELYLPRSMSKYDFCISVKYNMLIASAGIDESNGNGYYILWPQDPQKSANIIRGYLARKFKLRNVGVIITDSKLSPLRWGVTGYAVSHSGFEALNSYIGKPDIFGRKLKVEKLSISDSLATAAVAVMGEGEEQTPIAVIEDVPFVKFQKRNPTKKELTDLHINIGDDIFAPFLKQVKWRKGRGGKNNFY